MANEKQIRQIIIVFARIMQTLVDPTFKVSKGGATTRTLTNFLNRIEKEYGGVSCERIVDYCVFSAYSLRNQTRGLPQYFGPALIKKYGQNTRSQRYYQDQWLKTCELSRSILLSLIKERSVHPQQQFVYLPSEEKTKERKLNQRVGYLICQTSTLGWSPQSFSCQQCDFVPECQRETARKYPEIFRLRIENGDS